MANQQIDSRDDRVNIMAIQNYVIDNIHLNDIDPAKLGYVHATAAEVWRTGCGTATDKAVLLAAMLNEVGYKARVMGDAYDEVGVTIDTLEYRLNVRKKGPMVLDGEAKDEVKTVKLDGTYDATFDTLEDGFYQFRLPAIAGSPAVRAANLARVRTAPLQSGAFDINSDVTYRLPKGMKLVGGNIERKANFQGLGSVEVSVKQSGKKLRVVRKLKIDKSLIPVEDYSNYCTLLAKWQGVDKVLLRVK